MEKHSSRSCPQAIVLSFLGILVSIGICAIGLYFRNEKKAGIAMAVGVVLVIVFTFEFIYYIKVNQRYQLCIKKGHDGKGVVTQILHRTSKHRIISHYLVVKFQSDGVEYLTEVRIGESSLDYISIGTEVPLIIYEKYAILG